MNMSNPVFTPWVDGDYASLCRFALGLARREAEAGDLVQPTLSIRATKRGALREATKAKSWRFTTL